MQSQDDAYPTTIGRVRAVCRSPALALSLAALFWAGNFIAGRALRDDIDALSLNFIRWLTALAILAPFVWREARASGRVILREWRLILGLGATGIAGFHTLAYLALQTTTATNALLTLSLAPFAILVGAALIGMERLSHLPWFGILLSTAGVICLVARGDLATFRATDINLGDLWMLAGIVVWAIYALLLRRRPADLPQNVALAASIVAGVGLMAPFLPLTPGMDLASLATIPFLLSIAYIATFASVLAFLLWSHGVSVLGPGRAGQFVHLMPVFGAVLAAGLLDEIPTPPQLVGAILVFAGILMVERRARARRLDLARGESGGLLRGGAGST